MEPQPTLSENAQMHGRSAKPFRAVFDRLAQGFLRRKSHAVHLDHNLRQPAMLVRFTHVDGQRHLVLVDANEPLLQLVGGAVPFSGPINLSLVLARDWYDDLLRICEWSATGGAVQEQAVERVTRGGVSCLREIVVPTAARDTYLVLMRDADGDHPSAFDSGGGFGRQVDALQGIEQPIALWDFDDRLTGFNQRLPYLFPTLADIIREGLEFRDFLQAMIDRGVIDAVVHPENWIGDYIQRFRHSGTETMLTLADGRIIRSTNYLVDGGVTVTAWIDVTDMLRAEAEATHAREVLQDAIESCGEGIAIYDKMDRIVMYNSNFADHFPGATELMTPGTTFAQLCVWIWEAGLARNKSLSCEQWVERQVSARQRLSGSLERQYPSGRWAKVTERRMRSGGTVQIITDITDQKRQQSLLRERDRQLTARLGELGHAHRTLEKQAGELRDLAVENQQQRERAEDASRAKSEFLAMVSHDIRTPLNGVLGMAELLQLTDLSDGQRAQVETIQTCGEGLQTLLNDILDLTKIEAGRMELSPHPVDVRSMIAHVGDLMQARIREKGLALNVLIADSVPDTASLDEMRLRQILFNLVGNAVKFTDTGGITVRVVLQERVADAPRLVFAVEDTGTGLPKDDLDQIFEPFNQGSREQGEQTKDGAGLGLNICKRLVEHMGGAIAVDAQLGVGSTFTFWIPLPGGKADAESADAEHAPEGHERDVAKAAPRPEADEAAVEQIIPRRILMADDNQVNLLVFGKMLAPFRHQVTQVSDGKAAVDALRAEDFDIVLMDVGMPVMDGVEATKVIREMDGPKSRTPILGLTAHGMDAQRESFIAAGMSDVLIKPIGIEELIRGIQTLTAEHDDDLADMVALAAATASQSEQEAAGPVAGR